MQQIRNNPLPYIVQAVTLLLFILNLWLASKLAPLAQDIAVIQEKVDAQEIELVPRSELEGQFDNITNRLDRIESKLDRVIESHVN